MRRLPGDRGADQRKYEADDRGHTSSPPRISQVGYAAWDVQFECKWNDMPVQSVDSLGQNSTRQKGSTMNKRKKVAWHKHLKSAKRKEARRRAEGTTARR